MKEKKYIVFQLLSGKLTAFVEAAPISAEEKTRLQHYTIFLSVGISTMLVYGVFNLFQGNLFLCLLILCSGVGLLVGLVLLRNLKKGRRVYRINTILFGALIICMMLVGGESGSKILWMYTFPLIAFFLFGKTEGLCWSGVMLLTTLLVFLSPLQEIIPYGYHQQFKTRFLTTYLIVSSLTYWFEASRLYYKKRLEEKNRTLEEEKERVKIHPQSEWP